MDNNIRLGDVLHHIYKLDVALEDGHASKKQVLMFFLKTFKDFCFRKCPTIFKKYFHHYYLTGSYFEGLRVKEATEFDINVAFNFPFNQLDYVINELDELPSFGTFQLKSTNFKEVLFFDSRNYLSKTNILEWFQSLLDTFLNSDLMNYPGVVIMRSSSSGPARTVKILYNGSWISVDLVPVFSLDSKYLKRCSMHFDCRHKANKINTCYVVPKPLKEDLSCYVPQHILTERVWRIHFPEAEKIFLRKKNNLKIVIKLVKALRDKEEWPLSSYFLKVVALWMVRRHPDEDFWAKIKVDTLFLLYLNALEEHLATESLGHVFYPRFNLCHNLHQPLLRNLQLRINKIIRLLEKNPESAFVLFKVKYIPGFSLITWGGQNPCIQ